MTDADLGRALLTIARSAIGAELGLPRGRATRAMPRWRSPAATFVTLKLAGELRGCIGSLEAAAPARRRRARERDRRRVPRPALPAARASSSSRRCRSRCRCCRPTSASTFATRSDLLARLRPGVDGLVLEYGRHRATFLPQVWEALPDPREFLAALKRKAGLPADFWSPQLNVSRYGVTKWTESEFLLSEAAAMSNFPGRWWHRLDDGRIQCDLCPRDCRLHEGQRGACFVRQREGDAMVLTTYGRSSGFCIDPIEKKPLNHFYPGSLGVLVRHRRLQPRLQVLPELGHLEVARDGHADGRGVAGGDRRDGGEDGLPERGLHLQRPGHLRRVRDGHRRRLPRAGHQDGGGHRRLHRRRRAARVLREDGRRQRRPQGLHRRVLREALRRAPAAGARHARLPQARDRRLVRDHDAADPGQERLRRRARGDVRVDRARARPRRAAALHRVPSRLQDDGPRRARRRRRSRGRATSRCRAGIRYVYTGNVHDRTGGTTFCPGCGKPRHRARLARDPGLRAHRRRPLPPLRRAASRALRGVRRAVGPAPRAGSRRA